jgi:hypothetical protein
MSLPAVVDPTDTLAVLKAAREWLSDPEHWTTETFWRDVNGHAITPSWGYPRDAVYCACAEGALGLVDLTPRGDPRVCSQHGPRDALAAALGRTIPYANDELGYAYVLEGFDKAIAQLESEAR